VFTYIYLACGCVVLGTVFTYLLLAITTSRGVDLFNNLWLLGIPSVLSVSVNVLLVELYNRFREKQGPAVKPK
jgi:hypothetical protein